uniref:Monooxygenase, FAD-binding domain-containing protein n=1 Tax=uncultured marine group II/III euryarchaeote KM3_76_C12 TaxID=1456506 RepID=A0A075HS09_9EURY|nr:monooxygenase, FAD-binding domain-containing protein [uncultured marine group II/III euryarchaeote KM3_76_C12]
MAKEKITLIGAGLAGPLMATYLAKRDFTVDIFERRPDMRKVSQSAGRSINLALSVRGIHALKEVGLYEKIAPMTIPMKGRRIHDLNGGTHLQPYGQKKEEVIYSVSRAQLNMDLMSLAEETGNVRIHFNHKLITANLDGNELKFQHKADKLKSYYFTRVVGCDGSSSVLREAIVYKTGAKYEKKPLGHGYKELVIPPSKTGQFLLDSKALHIWPRGQYMLIALPNMDKSFTCTLFFPLRGKTSFETVKSDNEIMDLFNNQFPDVIELIPSLINDFQKNTMGNLASVYCDPWHFADKAALLGDAAHAVVPFFGQGMNASFQDCSVLNTLIEKHKGDWESIFKAYSFTQIPNGHAIADMAIENYYEMRDHVNDPEFIKRRKLELELEKLFPDQFIPRYSMVSFHQFPYAEVYKKGEKQFKIIEEVLKVDPSGETIDKSLVSQLMAE